MKRFLFLILFLAASLFPAFSNVPASSGTVLTQTSEKVVYITRTGTKYHTANCRYLSRSKIKTSLKEAVKNRYTACKVCKP